MIVSQIGRVSAIARDQLLQGHPFTIHLNIVPYLYHYGRAGVMKNMGSSDQGWVDSGRQDFCKYI